MTVAALNAQAPSADDLRRSKCEIGEALRGQLEELYRRPSASAAEECAINLGGAQRAVLRLADAIRREGLGDGR